jgi:hypothetical protein
MTTGTIKSGNFVTGIAPYSTSGTLILTNGSIISKTLVLIQVVLQHLEVLWLEVAFIEVVTSQLIQMVM